MNFAAIALQVFLFSIIGMQDVSVSMRSRDASIFSTSEVAVSQKHSRILRFKSERWKRKPPKKPKTTGSVAKLDREQVLIPGLSFSSASNLTSWVFSGHRKSKTKTFVPHLQIWRTSSPGSGIYQLISNTPVNLDLLSEEPDVDEVYFQIPLSPIIVESGDFIGVYQPSVPKSQFVIYVREGMAVDAIHTKSSVDAAPIVGDTFNVNDGDVRSNHDLVLVSFVATPLEKATSQLSMPSVTTSTLSFNAIMYRTSSQSLRSASFSYSPAVMTDQSEVAMTVTNSWAPLSSVTSLSAVLTGQFSQTPTTYLAGVLLLSSVTSISAVLTGQFSQITTTYQAGVLLSPSPTHLMTHSRTTTVSNSLGSSAVIIGLPVTPTPDLVLSPEWYHIPTASDDGFMTPDPVEKTFTADNTHQSIGTDDIHLQLEQEVYESQVEGSGEQDNGQNGVDLFIVIVIGALLGVTSITTVIAIIAFSVVVALTRKKSSTQIIQDGARPNKYIEKTVCSPLYEGLDETATAVQPAQSPTSVPPPKSLQLALVQSHSLPKVTPSERTGHSQESRQSTESDPVRPKITITFPLDAQYDKLASKKPQTPVSPYEQPVLSDDNIDTLPSGSSLYNSAYGLDLYVPDEFQRRQIVSGHTYDLCGAATTSYEFDEKLYISLYQAQHSVTSSTATLESDFFQEADEFWVPSSNVQSLYSQLAKRKYREIPRHRIRIIEYLGSGQFGTVNKAIMKFFSGEVGVAVKMLKTGASEQEKVKFLQEAAISGQFRHPNIVKLLGVVTVGEPAMIVLELMKNGNLKKFLSSRKPGEEEEVPRGLPTLLLNFCVQVAAGMQYLAKKTFVHRDLAARNILISDELVCKVSDFGMSRDLDKNTYYVSQGGLIPIKWTAPEALYYRKYSSATDVWSFGVLMFEVWTMGRKPFASLTNEEYIEKVDEGLRLSPPPGCPRPIYELMIDCWHPDPHKRPDFSAVLERLQQPSKTLLELGMSKEELAQHPKSATLCASLKAGCHLFKALQNKYLESEEGAAQT